MSEILSYIKDQPDSVSKALQALHEMIETNARADAGVCWKEFIGTVIAMTLFEREGRDFPHKTTSEIIRDIVERAFRAQDFDLEDFFHE